ncbi:MAG TPA: hypothetical protein VJ837_05555 [Candidatus Paceibacterota bacterium]|nr:hypothetical protein [Candidatus Paceibacterota bacterium]
MSQFDMNALIRGHAREEPEPEGEGEPKSIGGKSDGGAGGERFDTGAIDMNEWLRDAVHESRGRPTF